MGLDVGECFPAAGLVGAASGGARVFCLRVLPEERGGSPACGGPETPASPEAGRKPLLPRFLVLCLRGDFS